LINLLNTRRSITLKTIKETCNIPERTAYRYLNTISEANVPIYFDKSIQAYRLNATTGLSINDVSFGEGVLLVLALKVLGAAVSEHYRKDIERLITKVVVRHESEIESVLGGAAERLVAPLDRIDLSNLLSSALVHAAVCAGREVKITRYDKDTDKAGVEVSQPRLLFRKAWQVAEKSLTDQEASPLQSIDKVEVL
jgi:predicted DNA-binding transcriptional regulator YafY